MGLKIGILGFGVFGQFLAKRFIARGHAVFASSRTDYTLVAHNLGLSAFFQDPSDLCRQEIDCLLISVSILSFESVLKDLPLDLLRGKLIIDVLSVKMHPRDVLVQALPASADILCSHPMFGPESGKNQWTDLPFVYDPVRITDQKRLDAFLEIFAQEGCRMVHMGCEEHDEVAAKTQFVAHTTARLLETLGLQDSPINTASYNTLCTMSRGLCQDSFDLYAGLYRFNPHAPKELDRMHRCLDSIRQSLVQSGSTE